MQSGTEKHTERRYWANQGTREIQCPFFKMHNEKEIVCEGITDKCMSAVHFLSKREKLLYQKTYCEKRYQQCEYYRMLMEKYKDD